MLLLAAPILNLVPLHNKNYIFFVQLLFLRLLDQPKIMSLQLLFLRLLESNPKLKKRMSSEHFLQSHGPGHSDFHGFGPRATTKAELRKLRREEEEKQKQQVRV